LLTATEGNLRESATETIPPKQLGKGEKCGSKKPFLCLVTDRDGKPCLLQGDEFCHFGWYPPLFIIIRSIWMATFKLDR